METTYIAHQGYLWVDYCQIPALCLTHWGWVMYICVIKLTIIGSDNGLLPGRCQAIIWTNAGVLLIGPLGINFSEISSRIDIFSFKKMHLKLSSAKWQPFGLGLNVLMYIITWLCDILALVWHFGPACVTFRPGLCDILALSCVTKASACHHTPILTTGAVYRKFHWSSVSKTT